MSSIVSDISELASQLGDAELVAAVASFLDDGDIPYVLWDKWLLRLYGVPTIVDVRLDSTLSCCICVSMLMFPPGTCVCRC